MKPLQPQMDPSAAALRASSSSSNGNTSDSFRPPSVMGSASAGVATAIAVGVAAVLLQRRTTRMRRMRRSSTSTTVPSPSSSSGVASVSATTASSLFSLQRQVDPSAAALRASSSSSNGNNSDSSPAPAAAAIVSAAAPAPVMASASTSASSHYNNYQNNNSIADLAPFVASVLRDQVVTDLLAESKLQLEDRLRLELTGRKDDPKYCETSMKQGISLTDPDGTPNWLVFFDPKDVTNTTITNFIERVAGLELRLGGIVVFKFNGAIFHSFPEHTGFDRTRDDEPQMARVAFVSSDDIRVVVRVGPILYNDFVTLPRRMHVPGLVGFLKDHQTNNSNHTVLLPQLQILSVSFPESQITGLLPLLQPDDRLRLELMGPNGTPKYCEISMKHGNTMERDGNPNKWIVSFNRSADGFRPMYTIIPNFLETVPGLELRVGGIVNLNFGKTQFYPFPVEEAGFDRALDHEPQMGEGMFFNNDNGIRVIGRVGPILYEDYVNLRHSLPHHGNRAMKVPDLVRFLKDHQTNNNNDTVLLPQLQIRYVSFPESHIKGILPLLKDTTTGELSTSE